MSALFLIPLGATSLGGALALGALFHYCNGRRVPPRSIATVSERIDFKTVDVSNKSNSKTVDASNDSSSNGAASTDFLDELERRERSLTDFCDRANAELDAKRLALENLTRQATEAASALGRVLDSFSTAFGDSAVRSATSFEPFRALENELRTELRENERSDASRRRVVRRG